MNDDDSNGVLDFDEFYRMSVRQEWLFQRLVKQYCRLVVPPPRRQDQDETGKYIIVILACMPISALYFFFCCCCCSSPLSRHCENQIPLFPFLCVDLIDSYLINHIPLSGWTTKLDGGARTFYDSFESLGLLSFFVAHTHTHSAFNTHLVMFIVIVRYHFSCTRSSPHSVTKSKGNDSRCCIFLYTALVLVAKKSNGSSDDSRRPFAFMSIRHTQWSLTDN